MKMEITGMKLKAINDIKWKSYASCILKSNCESKSPFYFLMQWSDI